MAFIDDDCRKEAKWEKQIAKYQRLLDLSDKELLAEVPAIKSVAEYRESLRKELVSARQMVALYKEGRYFKRQVPSRDIFIGDSKYAGSPDAFIGDSRHVGSCDTFIG